MSAITAAGAKQRVDLQDSSAELLAGRLADCHDDLALTLGVGPPTSSGSAEGMRQVTPTG